MTDRNRSVRRTQLAVSASAIFLALLGIALTFGPTEVAGLFGLPSAPLALQLLGSALLGFGVMNWTARGSTLGGIYGRAVVAGNQMHFTVGALALLKHGFAVDGSPAFWALTTVYVLGAALFLHLMFGGGPRL
jgi:hypothetical protein